MVFIRQWSAASQDPLFLFDASASGVIVGPDPVETWRSVVISFVWVVSSCGVVL